MIKYLLTENSLFIPGLMTTILTDNPDWDEVVSICKNPDSEISDLSWVNASLNYESDEISISDTEVYYNGKYYPLTQEFANNCRNLLLQRTAFKREMLAKFLLKVLRNPNYSYGELFHFLWEHHFNFLEDGNILVYTGYSSDDEYKRGKYYEQSLRKIQFGNQDGQIEGPYTIVSIDPSEIQNGHIENYIIVDVEKVNFLRNTFMNLTSLSAVLSYLIMVIPDHPDCFSHIDEFFGKDMSRVLKDKSDLFRDKSRDTYREDMVSLALRLCQE
jgi:hypothetical protein